MLQGGRGVAEEGRVCVAERRGEGRYYVELGGRERMGEGVLQEGCGAGTPSGTVGYTNAANAAWLTSVGG